MTLLQQLFKDKFIRDERDKFTVGGALAADIYAHAEYSVYRINPAAVPRHLYRMPYGALYFAGGGAELFGNIGIELLGYVVYYRRVFHRHLYAFAQIDVTFDVRRYAYGYKYIAYLFVD